MHTTQTLLRYGASMSEINCVRKHISRIKGERLPEAMPCPEASRIMSDVEGGDPETGASGLTHMDATTFNALGIISRYDRIQNTPGRWNGCGRGRPVPYRILPESALGRGPAGGHRH